MKYFLIAVTFLFLSACKTSKDTVFTAPYDEELLDTLTVTAPVYVEGEKESFILPTYNPSAERSYDLLHTKLELSFDWDQEHVIGRATLDFAPIFYEIDKVVLDAQYFILNKITDAKTGADLTYTYDDKQITIALGRKYSKEESISILIDYTARPGKGPVGGSQAITSDKGLFFINADGSVKGKPRQIWTQGETENNSRWFPTFDKPNERCTQEIYLTVDENLETLSNGKLVSTTVNSNGTKTDYWKQDKPHAPYLFMVAVGDFARVFDSWNDLPLEYMVDPPYEKDAKTIFNHTPEMLTFFSDMLDYPYPWDKYSQVVVEDFVSGAMENTTAVTFGDFVQKTSRELIDNPNDKIVAHEMFHHWFGDLVTCESWANLTLNEGFANYSEYLWYEHKYGKDAADHHRDDELNTYLYMVNQTGTHPLIHYGYDDKEEMFDVHSYNKGGLVLHMLRNYIGDKAFFAALHKYLVDNRYTAVEVDELRMAFEDVTGKDLNWFFDQWYLDEGHAVLEFDETYNEESNALTLEVRQVQDIDYHRPVFILPLPVAIINQNGNVNYRNILIDKRKQKITLENIDSDPLAVILDGKAFTLAEVNHEYTEDELGAIVKYSPQWTHKMTAVRQFPEGDKLSSLSNVLMGENHFSLRLKGLDYATIDDLQIIKTLAKTDKHSAVRARALTAWATLESDKAVVASKSILQIDEDAYPVIKSALNVLYDYDNESALKFAEKLADDPSPTLVPVLSELLAGTGNAKYIAYFQKNMNQVDVYQVFNFYGAYSNLLQAQTPDLMYEEVMKLKDAALIHGNVYHRFMATTTINDVKLKLGEINEKESDPNIETMIESLSSVIDEIKRTEKNTDLLGRYKSY